MNKYLIIIVLIIILLLVIYNTNLNKNLSKNRNREHFQAVEYPLDVKNITELVEKGTDGKAGTQGIQGPRGPRGYPGKDATSDIGKVIKRKDKNIGIGTNEPESNLELHGFMNMVGTKGTGKTNNHTYTSYYPAGKSNPRYASVGFLEKDSKDFTLLNENEEGSINIKNKTGSFMMGADGETLLKNVGGSFGIDKEGKVDFKNKNGSVILDKNGNTSISNNLDLSKNLKVGGNADISKNMKVSGNVNFGKNLKVADSISAKGLNVSNDINAKGLNVSNLNISKNLGVGTNKPKSKLHIDKGGVIITDGNKQGGEGNSQLYTGHKGHFLFRKLGPNHRQSGGTNDLMVINPAGHTHIQGDFHAKSNITLNTGVAGGKNHPNGWIFHAPRDSRKTLFIAPHKKGTGWDWGKQMTINGKNGAVGINGILSTTGPAVYHNAADFSIGRNNRFGRGNCGACRALVHAGGNKLNINYANDFKGGTTVTGKFCIGNTCIDENDLKKIKSSSVHSVVGWAIHPTFPIFNTYGKPYTLGTSGGKHGFNHHLHSWEGGDQWDQVYMYRGWRIEAWHHGDTHPRHKVLDFTSRSSNKGSWSHVFHQNTITTYRTTWVGY